MRLLSLICAPAAILIAKNVVAFAPRTSRIGTSRGGTDVIFGKEPSDSSRLTRVNVLFAQEDNINSIDESATSDAVAEKYGFDQKTTSQQQTAMPPATQQTQSDRLRRSLDESAKFKVRNDARFTWLSTLLVSGVYAYGCLAPDGEPFLGSLGIPSGGIVGGVAGVFFSLISIVLFFAPELFAKKR
ncbi:unnamed protein product [Pseudo-nitzschia multistriata]|uniref:Uncharacterized protein n=1 Tax=Pseudo-nitzschia multistriata TaxID=183589 RepID=A0A448ZN85_9STRA|nr:unnamed protein product [Pseudo-nitzschia multistriata]